MIQDAFHPFDMRRIVLALRPLLNTNVLTLTRTGTYDGKNVVIGHRQDQLPVIIYFNTEPSIYAGPMESKVFPRPHYVIEKNAAPPFNFDGQLVRWESFLPDTFGLKDNLKILNFKPNKKFEPNHLNRWRRFTIDTATLTQATETGSIKNLWSWTYEIDLNTASGTNAIYCRSKKDINRLQMLSDAVKVQP